MVKSLLEELQIYVTCLLPSVISAFVLPSTKVAVRSVKLCSQTVLFVAVEVRFANTTAGLLTVTVTVLEFSAGQVTPLAVTLAMTFTV